MKAQPDKNLIEIQAGVNVLMGALEKARKLKNEIRATKDPEIIVIGRLN